MTFPENIHTIRFGHSFKWIERRNTYGLGRVTIPSGYTCRIDQTTIWPSSLTHLFFNSKYIFELQDYSDEVDELSSHFCVTFPKTLERLWISFKYAEELILCSGFPLSLKQLYIIHTPKQYYKKSKLQEEVETTLKKTMPLFTLEYKGSGPVYTQSKTN